MIKQASLERIDEVFMLLISGDTLRESDTSSHPFIPAPPPSPYPTPEKDRAGYCNQDRYQLVTGSLEAVVSPRLRRAIKRVKPEVRPLRWGSA